MLEVYALAINSKLSRLQPLVEDFFMVVFRLFLKYLGNLKFLALNVRIAIKFLFYPVKKHIIW
jgi:hypothetical protein